MSYFDNSNGQPTITHSGPGSLGGAGAQSILDSTNSSGNQLVYVPDPAWIGGNFPQYGFMFNWTGTGLEIECEASTPVNQQSNVPHLGWVAGGTTLINPIPCQEGDSIHLYDNGGSLVCQFTVPTFNKTSFTPPSTFPDSSGGANNGQWGTYTLTYAGQSGTQHFYQWFSGGFEIYYDTATQKWHDPNTTAEPHSLSSTNSSTPGTDSGVVVNGDTIYCHNGPNGGTILYQFTMSGGVASSGGGASGGSSGGGPSQPAQPSTSKKVFHNFW